MKVNSIINKKRSWTRQMRLTMVMRLQTRSTQEKQSSTSLIKRSNTGSRQVNKTKIVKMMMVNMSTVKMTNQMVSSIVMKKLRQLKVSST